MKYNCEECKYVFEKHGVPAFTEDGKPNYATECPKCKQQANMVFRETGFISSGPVNSLDKVVGRAAAKQWESQYERKSKREKVRKESGSIAVGLAKAEKDASGKINYEYSSVSKERVEQRKGVYNEQLKTALTEQYKSEKAQLKDKKK